MEINKLIENIISPPITEMGFEIVRILVTGGDYATLQVMAERKDGKNMTVADCASISRAISPLLEEEDPLKGRYNLEVSSPGLDRPLVKLSDFERFCGYEAKFESKTPIDNRKKFKGTLKGVVDGGFVVIETKEQEEYKVPFDDIEKAKLVLTDALLKKAKEEQED